MKEKSVQNSKTFQTYSKIQSTSCTVNLKDVVVLEKVVIEFYNGQGK